MSSILKRIEQLVETPITNYPNIIPELKRLIIDNSSQEHISNLVILTDFIEKSKEELGSDISLLQNYKLLNSLLNIFNTQDFWTFKVLYDVVLVFFRVYKDSYFDVVELHKDDMYWKWGEKKLKTFQRLVSIITAIVDDSSTTASSIDIASVMDSDVTIVSDFMITNFKRYYDV